MQDTYIYIYIQIYISVYMIYISNVLCSLHLYSGARYTKNCPYFPSFEIKKTSLRVMFPHYTRNKKKLWQAKAAKASSHWTCSIKNLFLCISQNSLENTCDGVSFLIKSQFCDELLFHTKIRFSYLIHIAKICMVLWFVMVRKFY